MDSWSSGGTRGPSGLALKLALCLSCQSHPHRDPQVQDLGENFDVLSFFSVMNYLFVNCAAVLLSRSSCPRLTPTAASFLGVDFLKMFFFFFFFDQPRDYRVFKPSARLPPRLSREPTQSRVSTSASFSSSSFSARLYVSYFFFFALLSVSEQRALTFWEEPAVASLGCGGVHEGREVCLKHKRLP